MSEPADLPGPSGSGSGGLFSRDEVLGGMAGKRASALVYAIERRTATLSARSRQAMAEYQTDRSAEESERSYFAALSAGRYERLRPRVQDLERYAAQWTDLVPADANTRAAMVRLIADSYSLPRDRVPGIRAALGLTERDVQTAFERTTGRGLETIWADGDLAPGQRLRWWLSRWERRFESLPPSWMAFALTLTEAIGVGVLVVPVALAGLGPLPALVLLVVLGLANLITVAALVEAITRSGSMRYGTAYFGRLISDLLGHVASGGAGLSLLALNLVTLLAFYLAFGTTIASSTGTWAGAWVALIFGVNVVFLYRESIHATVASAIVIGAANIVLILLLVVLALPHVSAAHLTYADVPLVDGTLDTSVLTLVFGVVLMAYFGHTSAANAAKAVLRVDPSGSGLLRGNIAALVAVIALYCVTVAVFLGAVGSEPLIDYDGTVITPLAAVAGPAIDVVGGLYVTLALGLGSVHVSLGLYNQVREVLPRRSSRSTASPPSSLLARAGFQRFLALLPVILVFVMLEGLILADAASVTDPLGIVGTLAIPLIGGVFPMLLLAAARRRGELVPGHTIELIGSRPVVVVTVLLFIAALFVHGLLIWQEPVARLLAMAVGTAMVLLVIRLLQARRFRPLLVVELRRWGERGRRQLTNVVNAGHEVSQASSDASERVDIEMTQPVGTELLAWVHRVTPEGDSQPLRSTVSVGFADSSSVEVELHSGRRILRTEARPQRVSISIDPSDT